MYTYIYRYVCFFNKYQIIKMPKASAEAYEKNCIYAIKVNKKVGKEYSLWIRMIDIYSID